MKRKPNGYWTKEKCAEEAAKYETRGEFKNNSSGAYDKAKDKKWLDEICSHMIRPKPYNFIWTKEKCAEELLKYDNKTIFSKNSRGAHSSAQKNGWLDEFFPKNK